MAASRVTEVSTGPKVGVGTVPAGTELVRARKRMGQNSSHQRASCAERAGGEGQEEGSNTGLEEPQAGRAMSPGEWEDLPHQDLPT